MGGVTFRPLWKRLHDGLYERQPRRAVRQTGKGGIERKVVVGRVGLRRQDSQLLILLMKIPKYRQKYRQK
jgi:hypothetical protein